MKIEFLFVRKERKYLIDDAVYNELKGEISTQLKVEQFSRSAASSFVESIYLDNYEWKAYREHKNREKVRFKVRIRKYGLNGRRCFVELKEKIDMLTRKSRFKIEAAWVDDFLGGKDIICKLCQYNREMTYSELHRLYRKIKGKIDSYRLEPVVQIRYQRQSFRDPARAVRITFDRNLHFRAIPNSFMESMKKSHSYPTGKIIMETKTDGSRPQWMKALVARYGLRKERFSKYCSSIETLYIPVSKEESEAEYAGFS